MIKNPPDFKLGAGLAAFCLFLLVFLIPNQVGALDEQASLMPLIITALILVLSVALMLRSLRLPEAQPQEHRQDGRSTALTIALVVAIMAVYAGLLELTGFLLTSLAAMVVLFLVFGVKSPLKIAAITIITLGTLYFSFEKLLRAPLPMGSLIEALLD